MPAVWKAEETHELPKQRRTGNVKHPGIAVNPYLLMDRAYSWKSFAVTSPPVASVMRVIVAIEG